MKDLFIAIMDLERTYYIGWPGGGRDMEGSKTVCGWGEDGKIFYNNG